MGPRRERRRKPCSPPAPFGLGDRSCAPERNTAFRNGTVNLPWPILHISADRRVPPAERARRSNRRKTGTVDAVAAPSHRRARVPSGGVVRGSTTRRNTVHLQTIRRAMTTLAVAAGLGVFA